MTKLSHGRARGGTGVPLGACWALAAALVWSLAGAGAAQSSDLWYVVELDGQRAGWQHERVEADGERIVTRSEMHLEIRRGAVAMGVRVLSEFVESAQHEPLEWRITRQTGAAPIEQEYRFGEGEVVVVTEQNGQRSSRTLPLGERTWLTPGAAAKLLAARLGAMPREISLTTLDPMSGLAPVTLKYENPEAAEAEAMGRTVPAIRARLGSSATPGVATEVYVDERGRLVRSRLEMMGMLVEVIAADRELAMAELDPPELMARTLVGAGRAIAGARGAKRGVYVLSVREGRLEDVPESGAQRAERMDEGRVRVVVDLTAPAAEAQVEDEGPYLAASAMIDCEDEKIRELALRGAGRRGGEPAAVAERLRRMVYGYIDEKDLSVGFATASEVARTRQGDCTEHAALLAAVLRAREIPARVVSGLVYVDRILGEEHVFGYHMWTQALLEVDGRKRWVDLDATTAAPFDATHIALLTSDLGDGETANALVRLAPLLGRLEISVEDVQGGG